MSISSSVLFKLGCYFDVELYELFIYVGGLISDQ